MGQAVTHDLKIEIQWANAKLAGDKPFEVRLDDRGYQRGHLVSYAVVDPKTGTQVRHPLERCTFEITYVQRGISGLADGYCVFADAPTRSMETVQ